MMWGPFEFGLHFEGFTDEQIAQIDAALPDLQQLADVLKSELPRIARVAPVIAMVLSTVNAQQKK